MSASPPLRRQVEIPKRLSGARFDRALAELFPERTRSQLQKLVRRGNVMLNGRRVLRSNFKLSGSEAISIQEGGEDGARAKSAELEITIIHEEDDFVVLHKPAGMITHPTEKHAGGTVADRVEQRYGPLPSTADAYRPGIVHRLDRETSGLMVIARNRKTLEDLQRQFRRRTVEKRYLAIVHGRPVEDRFEANAPIGPVEWQRDRQEVQSGGRSARTAFEVLRRWDEFSLLVCFPTTGRRHQLRVHLWSLGHPIAGDKLYRTAAGVERVRTLAYHALHAEYLAFDQPGGGSRVEFRSLLPEEMDEFLACLNSSDPGH